jgi:Tol biopolymer transport system component
MTVGRLIELTAVLGIAASAVVVTRAQQPLATGPAADMLLGTALHQADVEGNLESAIATYRRVLSDPQANRRTQAEALLGLGRAHEGLGQVDDARPHYERLRTQFSGTRPAVEAGRRLAALPPVRAGQAVAGGDRVVWARSEFIAEGRVSPDGRFAVSTDWNTGNLYLHDLGGGSSRLLADSKGWSLGNSYTATFSPDGRRVAYGWRTYGENAFTNEIRIVSLDGTGTPIPRSLYQNADIAIFNPTDWSPDGKYLAVVAERNDLSKQIAIVGVEDGSYRSLKTVGWRGPGVMFFSPDGRYLAYDLPANDDEVTRDVFVSALDGSSETHIEHPANDVVLGWSTDGSHLLFASDRNRTVGLWAVGVADGKARTAARLLKPDIGSVVSLGLTSSGALHLAKDASTRSLQIAPIDLNAGHLTGPAAIENFGVEYPTWSPDGKTLIYAHTGANGIRVLALRSLETGVLREVRPALEYFRASAWLPDGRSVITWGRDLKGRPGVYQIDLASGRHTLVADSGDIGNPQVSPDGRKIYYTRGQFVPAERPARFLEHDLASGAIREIQRGGGPTGGRLSPDGQFLAATVGRQGPSTWGVSIRPVGGEPRIYPVGTASSPVGTIENQPDWTPDGKAVLVLRALDGTPTRKELWLVPIDGRPARTLDINVDGWFFGPAGVRLSPDGTRITFLSGKVAQEVWRIESHLSALGAGR